MRFLTLFSARWSTWESLLSVQSAELAETAENRRSCDALYSRRKTDRDGVELFSKREARWTVWTAVVQTPLTTPHSACNTDDTASPEFRYILERHRRTNRSTGVVDADASWFALSQWVFFSTLCCLPDFEWSITSDDIQHCRIFLAKTRLRLFICGCKSATINACEPIQCTVQNLNTENVHIKNKQKQLIMLLSLFYFVLYFVFVFIISVLCKRWLATTL